MQALDVFPSHAFQVRGWCPSASGERMKLLNIRLSHAPIGASGESLRISDAIDFQIECRVPVMFQDWRRAFRVAGSVWWV